MSVLLHLRRWGAAAKRLFKLTACPICQTTLDDYETILCVHCLADMPRTRYHLWPDNPMERRLWGRFPLVKATALMHYQRGSSYAQLIWMLKYKGRRDLGPELGKLMARELRSSTFFDDIDLLLPVPLHWRRHFQRGYNQSYLLAKGVAQITGLPIDTQSLRRVHYTAAQVHHAGVSRWDNVSNIFQLRHPGSLAGRHVLLIDDVLTTGSTLTACADALRNEPGIRISVLTLAIAEE